MNGHASAEELELIKRLEAGIDLKESSTKDLLELGQLYIEPSHREAEAIQLFETVLQRDPYNASAKFWLAYCCVHYLMDEDALQRATDLLESVIERGDGEEYTSAAYMLLAEVLEEGDLSTERKIQLLEASVGYEPDWVYNHQSLAWAYMEAGKPSDALEQINQALSNVKSPDPEWSVTKWNFEETISGRIGNRATERLLADLEKLRAM
jgi:tetratricopeptide (TPR) repeat protein